MSMLTSISFLQSMESEHINSLNLTSLVEQDPSFIMGYVDGKYLYTINELISSMSEIIKNKGNIYSVEHLKNLFLPYDISICDVKNSLNDANILHHLSSYNYQLWSDNTARVTFYWGTTYNINVNEANVYLKVAGDKVWELLSAQTKCYVKTYLHDGIEYHSPQNTLYNLTPLHFAAKNNNVALIKIFLDAAGERASDLIAITNSQDKTAFDIANSKTQEVMLTYIQKVDLKK